MATEGVGIERVCWEKVINSFRGYCHDFGSSHEVAAVPLIARHDESLRFTNSTTSVMKPYILGLEKMPADRTYLVQPAMGSQGILAWRARSHLGPYASYFHSMGILYPVEMGQEAAVDMVSLASDIWGFDRNNTTFVVSERDKDIGGTLQKSGIDHRVDRSGVTAPYDHCYGNEEIYGRNTNLHVSIDDTSFGIGELTLISRDDKPEVWEVSFDSTNVIASLNRLAHPIDAFTHQYTLQNRSHRRVAADSAIISSVLSLEGINPSARGKSGILRKFFQTFVELVSPLFDDVGTRDELTRVADTEIKLRTKSILQERRQSVDDMDSEALLWWVQKFRSNI
jgi:hypothetical protein